MIRSFLRKNKLVFFLSTIIALTVTVKLFIFATSETSNTDKPMELKPVGQQPYIPSNLLFAEENVPLHHNDVKESLDRELLTNAYWHSQTILLFKRANRYFPIIEPILKQYGIPEDFKYIPVIESGFLNISSPSGAKGFWQLIEGTAKENGLEVNEDIDERNNIEKSTVAACNFFLQSYEKFKRWSMVAASYNMGMTGLGNQAKNQGTNDFYDLWLNTETSRYVFRIIAMKIIFENPKMYGIILKKSSLYPPFEYKNIEIDTTINSLFEFAQSKGISYKAFKTFNPWLVSTKLTNKTRKKYLIAIPDDGFRDKTFDSNE